MYGDLNVAHEEIDFKNPKTNRKMQDLRMKKEKKMSILLDSGFTDTFRYFYPNKENEYSWWSYFGKSRERNTGWRIDYFFNFKKIWTIDLLMHKFIKSIFRKRPLPCLFGNKIVSF